MPVHRAIIAAAAGLSSACIDTVRLDRLDSADDIADACARYETRTEVFLVEFPALTEPCRWDDPESLPPAEGYFTARAEQTQPLGLPADAVVCGMTFDLWGPDPGEEQDIIYDDHFLFTFDDVVLAASYGKAVDYLKYDGLLRYYDWDRIAGVKYTFSADRTPYCLGEDQGWSECEIPSTQLKGPIALDFDRGVVNQLSYAAVKAGHTVFGFVTVGDNDETDCQHEAFSFTVEVPYLVP